MIHTTRATRDERPATICSASSSDTILPVCLCILTIRFLIAASGSPNLYSFTPEIRFTFSPELVEGLHLPLLLFSIRKRRDEIRKSSTLAGSIRQFELFLQNKPNFRQNRAVVCSCKTKDYEIGPPFLAQKSQSQFHQMSK